MMQTGVRPVLLVLIVLGISCPLTFGGMAEGDAPSRLPAGWSPSCGVDSPHSGILVPVVEGEEKDPLEESMGEIKEQLEKLSKDLKGLEKDMRDRIQKDVLPRVKREIERLREWLKDMSPEPEETEPIKT